MRLIDADALKERKFPNGVSEYIDGWNDAISAIMVFQPTIDAEPAKHGHWIYKDGVRGFGLGAWCCSECGEENESLPFHKCHDPYEYAASKYCACCGARMKKND